MEKLKEFTISFSGLSIGQHEFDLKVDDSFFECFEYSEISKGDINIKLILEKNERFLILNFEYKGSLIAPCDRCLDNLPFEIDNDNRLIVKFSEQDDDYADDDVILLSEKDHKIDISKFVYESIILILPTQKTHESVEECNQDMIKYLSTIEPEKENDDPRWDSLKGLKFED